MERCPRQREEVARRKREAKESKSGIGVHKRARRVRLSFRKSVTLVVEGEQMVSCQGKFDDGKKVMADVVGVAVKKENGPPGRKGS